MLSAQRRQPPQSLNVLPPATAITRAKFKCWWFRRDRVRAGEEPCERWFKTLALMRLTAGRLIWMWWGKLDEGRGQWRRRKGHGANETQRTTLLSDVLFTSFQEQKQWLVGFQRCIDKIINEFVAGLGTCFVRMCVCLGVFTSSKGPVARPQQAKNRLPHFLLHTLHTAARTPQTLA